MKRVYGRGKKTVELPYLLSCALFLLDRRFWLLGVRYPLCGPRFDLLAMLPSMVENVVLVEAKYRGDGRPVRPSEVKRFSKEIATVKEKLPRVIVRGYFMTNTKFSEEALRLAMEKKILTFQKVPLLFDLKWMGGGKKSRKKKSNGPGEDLSSRFSNRAGRRGVS